MDELNFNSYYYYYYYLEEEENEDLEIHDARSNNRTESEGN